MKITEIYHTWANNNALIITFVRSNTDDCHRIKNHKRVTASSRNRYIALLNSSNVIYYSRAMRRYITVNALKVGA